tara:strand:- start:167 stop:526 length:360 start_codon:yes stop_codon:yes gene_type:complete
MPSDQEIEFKALRSLEKNPAMSQRELAERLGVSLGSAHYVLKALIDVGWVKLGNFTRSGNKLGYAYILTPLGVAEKAVITARFLARKREEYSALRREIEGLERDVEAYSSGVCVDSGSR